jgi:RecA-family ATPase
MIRQRWARLQRPNARIRFTVGPLILLTATNSQGVEFRVGDAVNAVVNGELVFPQARRIVGFHNDSKHGIHAELEGLDGEVNAWPSIEQIEHPPAPKSEPPTPDDDDPDAIERAWRQMRSAIDSARRTVDLAEPDGAEGFGDFRVKIFRMQTADLARTAIKLGLPITNVLLRWRMALERGFKAGEASLIVQEQSVDWLKAEIEEATQKALEEARKQGDPEPRPDPEPASDAPPPWECPKPYSFPDPASIPRRQFVFGKNKHYLRGEVSATIAAGGKAKTTLTMIEAVGMAAGRNLLTGDKLDPLRVWIVNAEEDQAELDRRIAAICLRYNVSKRECGDRLRVTSLKGPKRPRWHVATQRSTREGGGAVLNRPFLDWLTKTLIVEQIDVLMIDPLVSFHRVREGDNADMDLVIKEGLGEVAIAANVAIGVSHHTGKPKFGQDATVEDSRGASAIIWAARINRVINNMSKAEANYLGVAVAERQDYLRVDRGKANPVPKEKAIWLKLESEGIPNGDDVAVVSSWKPADPFAAAPGDIAFQVRAIVRKGEYRTRPNSPQWIGYAVAPLLGITLTRGANGNSSAKDVATVKRALKQWYHSGTLAVETRKNANGDEGQYVVAPPGWDKPETYTASPQDDYTDEIDLDL